MSNKLPPTPTGVPPGHSYWNDWYERLRNLVNNALINHNDLQNIQGGSAAERYHLTNTQHTDLTDGGDSALHFHSSDRARANHTGTQILSTISDVTITAANLNSLDDGVDSTLHFHASDRARANHTGTQDHNTTLSGLQGGVAGQYYHLTSAEYTSITGPVFSAYQSSSQSLASATYTKVQFQSEEFDTNSNFDSTTNYRFTPTVAGYYQIDAAVSCQNLLLMGIFKNGTEFKRGVQLPTGAASDSDTQLVVSSLISMNGSTDYVEIFAYQSNVAARSIVANAVQTYFQGGLIRPL